MDEEHSRSNHHLMQSLISKLSIVTSLMIGPLLSLCQGQVTAGWDPSPDPAVAGYYLCWGTSSGDYSFTNTYLSSEIAASVINLEPGQTYFFAVQAFSASGAVSAFSNEQMITVPGLTDTPTATNPPPATVTDKSPVVQTTLKSGNPTSPRGASDQSHLSGLAVTAPGAPSPVFQSAACASNRFTFTWSTTASQIYQIQYTTNLVQNVWANLGGAVVATGSSATLSDTVSNSQMFYRASLVPR